mmetsp:Transcript_5179/g.8435  ORF Transcript_5179/g.8435 Transcript_5179/m.8435 type:complete len:88 (+) Transcript_5179:1250-1513(+)
MFFSSWPTGTATSSRRASNKYVETDMCYYGRPSISTDEFVAVDAFRSRFVLQLLAICWLDARMPNSLDGIRSVACALGRALVIPDDG